MSPPSAHRMAANNWDRTTNGTGTRGTGRRQYDTAEVVILTAMSTSERVVVDYLPQGPLTGSEFRLEPCPVPEPGEGEVRVRVQALTIGAGQRAGLQGSASYAGAPTAGVVMGGTGIGVVEASTVEDLQGQRPRRRVHRVAAPRHDAGR